jgi:hypothetical protein
MNRPASPRDGLPLSGARTAGAAPARAICRTSPPRIAGTACTLLLLTLVRPVAASSWRFEAENINPASIHAAGNVIEVVVCNNASGGHALEGLNMLGDWAEIRVAFDRETCFIDSIRCASPELSTWQFLVEFRPEDSPDRVAWSEHASVAGRGAT